METAVVPKTTTVLSSAASHVDCDAASHAVRAASPKPAHTEKNNSAPQSSANMPAMRSSTPAATASNAEAATHVATPPVTPPSALPATPPPAPPAEVTSSPPASRPELSLAIPPTNAPGTASGSPPVLPLANLPPRQPTDVATGTPTTPPAYPPTSPPSKPPAKPTTPTPASSLAPSKPSDKTKATTPSPAPVSALASMTSREMVLAQAAEKTVPKAARNETSALSLAKPADAPAETPEVASARPSYCVHARHSIFFSCDEDMGPAAALFVYISSGNIGAVCGVLCAGADPNTKMGDLPALVHAIERRFVNVAILLLQAGESHSAAGGPWMLTPLMQASVSGLTLLIKVLIEAGAAADEVTPAGLTALRLAVVARHAAVIKLLIEKGAEVDRPGRFGWTALLEASFNNDVGSADVLIGCRATPDLSDSRGWTPLLVAAANGCTLMVSFLVNNHPASDSDMRFAALTAARLGQRSAASLTWGALTSSQQMKILKEVRDEQGLLAMFLSFS